MPTCYIPQSTLEEIVVELWLKHWLLLEVLDGRKVLEARPKESRLGSITAGQRIVLKSRAHRVHVRIDAVREYPDFEAMLRVERFENIASRARSAQELLEALRQLYTREREFGGVLVFQISDPRTM